MKHKCPVCGKHEFIEIGSFEICPVCGWEDDNLQGDDHNYAGGANDLSVNEARIEFFLLSKDSTQLIRDFAAVCNSFPRGLAFFALRDRIGRYFWQKRDRMATFLHSVASVAVVLLLPGVTS